MNGLCAFIKELPSRVSAAGNKRRVALWKCNCGKEFEASIGNVTSGQVNSCGCKKTMAVVQRCTTHGQSGQGRATRLYRFWQSMKDKCHNPKSTAYKHYGARGIVCHAPWRTSFETFSQYFSRHFNLNEIPGGLSMDREDNDGNYAPGNLRLATSIIQANNRRNNHHVVYDGKRVTVTQLARAHKMKPGTLFARINVQGKTIEEAILWAQK